MPIESVMPSNHLILQCMKVKSESEVAQLSPTLSDPMDRSLPGSSVHGVPKSWTHLSDFTFTSLGKLNSLSGYFDVSLVYHLITTY